MSYYKFQKRAFTLAEVLITLGIIGIVAAMTMQTLINSYKRKVFETKFKKGYSVLQNAYLVYSEINNNNIHTVISEREWYLKNENIAAIVDSFQNGTKSYNSSIPINGKLNSLKSYKQLYSILKYDGSIIRSVGINQGAVELNDGLTFIIFNNGVRQEQLVIILDINGLDSKPNRVGYDVFFFTIIDNKVIPIAPYGNSLYSISVLLDPDGGGITYYAVQNVCPTNPDKTYWECLKF